jgi:hypothetical protein
MKLIRKIEYAVDAAVTHHVPAAADASKATRGNGEATTLARVQ